MTRLSPSEARPPEPREDDACQDETTFSGQDIQERFAPLLLGFNEAHHELLEAAGPDDIRATDEPGTYEITIHCPMSVSVLTAGVISDGETDRIDPIDFRTTFHLPLLPVFSYDRECKDAYVNRLMTAWLEKSFLVHEPAILDGIRALQERHGPADAGAKSAVP